MCEYVSYGAEAVFFDDSVFWSGHFPTIRNFCQSLISVRSADSMDAADGGWISSAEAVGRLKRLQWGAQLTADLLTTLHSGEETAETLGLMRMAGCSYLYLGIESMSDLIMDGVHKNLRLNRQFSWKQKILTALERARDAGIRVGSSVLFGLENETQETIAETIEEVGRLIDDGLLVLASPNILTYHPGTPITLAHRMEDRIDYHSSEINSRPPYSYFEEAFPGVVSRYLSEQDIWHIHRASRERWGLERNQEQGFAHGGEM